MDDAVLIVTLSLIIIFSPFFAKRYKVPTTPVEIILGALFGYVGLLHHSNYFELVAEVGFLYLMFLAGMEVDLKQITGSSKKVINASVLFLLLMSFFYDSGRIYI